MDINNYFKIIEDSLKKIAKTTKNNSIITCESDLKCLLYSILKEKIKIKENLMLKGKYPRIMTELEYGKSRSEDYIADIVLVDEKDLNEAKDGSVALKKNIVKSIVIELKFTDNHYKKTKEDKIYDDCVKIIDSGGVKKGCVILFDIHKKDKLSKKELSEIKEELSEIKKDILRCGSKEIELVCYYINSNDGKILKQEL